VRVIDTDGGQHRLRVQIDEARSEGELVHIE
jgi:hypothetical protein